MKKLIVFDLDGTSAESKSATDPEMAKLLTALLTVAKAAVISGGDWPQFAKQVLANLPQDEHLEDLSLLPACGTKFYQYPGDWEKLYSEDFDDAEREKIVGSLTKALEALKSGGGTPPILTRHGWLISYHGVSKAPEPDQAGRRLCYSAGVMILSKERPRVIRYRSPPPVLTPASPDELRGTIANVVFPTGSDRRDDLGTPDRFDGYYGLADSRIGVARLDLPEHLPPSAPADIGEPATGGPA